MRFDLFSIIFLRSPQFFGNISFSRVENNLAPGFIRFADISFLSDLFLIRVRKKIGADRFYYCVVLRGWSIDCWFLSNRGLLYLILILELRFIGSARLVLGRFIQILNSWENGGADKIFSKNSIGRGRSVGFEVSIYFSVMNLYQVLIYDWKGGMNSSGVV